MSRFPTTLLAAALLSLGAMPLAAQEAAPSADAMPVLPQGEATAQQSVPADEAAPAQTRPMPAASGGSRCSQSKGLTS